MRAHARSAGIWTESGRNLDWGWTTPLVAVESLHPPGLLRATDVCIVGPQNREGARLAGGRRCSSSSRRRQSPIEAPSKPCITPALCPAGPAGRGGADQHPCRPGARAARRSGRVWRVAGVRPRRRARQAQPRLWEAWLEDASASAPSRRPPSPRTARRCERRRGGSGSAPSAWTPQRSARLSADTRPVVAARRASTAAPSAERPSRCAYACSEVPGRGGGCCIVLLCCWSWGAAWRALGAEARAVPVPRACGFIYVCN